MASGEGTTLEEPLQAKEDMEERLDELKADIEFVHSDIEAILQVAPKDLEERCVLLKQQVEHVRTEYESIHEECLELQKRRTDADVVQECGTLEQQIGSLTEESRLCLGSVRS
ncbi:hypothetical protein WMY93_008873 [Mugilogobius chulae]|uniref:Uncharacterized protein n=1 Tax=Mugilogobius chulae TaxID=88201 RepID=A0AAW0P9T2_9GOBI